MNNRYQDAEIIKNFETARSNGQLVATKQVHGQAIFIKICPWAHKNDLSNGIELSFTDHYDHEAGTTTWRWQVSMPGYGNVSPADAATFSVALHLAAKICHNGADVDGVYYATKQDLQDHLKMAEQVDELRRQERFQAERERCKQAEKEAAKERAELLKLAKEAAAGKKLRAVTVEQHGKFYSVSPKDGTVWGSKRTKSSCNRLTNHKNQLLND